MDAGHYVFTITFLYRAVRVEEDIQFIVHMDQISVLWWFSSTNAGHLSYYTVMQYSYVKDSQGVLNSNETALCGQKRVPPQIVEERNEEGMLR